MFRNILKTATNSKNRCRTTFSKQFNSRPFSSNSHSFQHEHSSKNSYEHDYTSTIDDGYDFNNFLPVASNEILRKLQNEDEMVKSSVGMLCQNAGLETQKVFLCPTQNTNSYTAKNRQKCPKKHKNTQVLGPILDVSGLILDVFTAEISFGAFPDTGIYKRTLATYK